jgi:hypothetical protein
VLKKRKSDIVNLPSKEAYVSGRRARHSDCQTTNPAASGAYVTLKSKGTFGACKTRSGQFCSLQQAVKILAVPPVQSCRLNLCRQRTDGLKVVAQCLFVKASIDKHPDYADLLKA